MRIFKATTDDWAEIADGWIAYSNLAFVYEMSDGFQYTIIVSDEANDLSGTEDMIGNLLVAIPGLGSILIPKDISLASSIVFEQTLGLSKNHSIQAAQLFRAIYERLPDAEGEE